MRLLCRIIIVTTLICCSFSCKKVEKADPCANGCTLGCADHSPELQTTLHYFMGTDLKSYYYTNVDDMEAAVAKGSLGCNGKFYYLFPTSASEATLYEVIYKNGRYGGEGVSQEVKSYTNFASVSEESLQMVLEDVAADSGYDRINPEHTMNLIIGSHGMGWELTEPPRYTASTMQCAPSIDQIERGHPGVENQIIPTRYMGLSEKPSEGTIDIEEIRTAIDQSGIRLGFIIFDACFMSSIEVYYRLRNCCDYIVASPAEVMAAGFPFETIIPQLFTDNGRSYDLTAVCGSFHSFYTNDYSTKSGTIAMCVTSELPALARVVSTMNIRELTEEEIKSLQSYERYTNHKFYDLGDYITTACDDTEALSAFQTQFDCTFPTACRLHTPTFYTGVKGSGANTRTIDYYSGVTTSEPSNNTNCYGWELEPWAIAAGRNESPTDEL